MTVANEQPKVGVVRSSQSGEIQTACTSAVISPETSCMMGWVGHISGQIITTSAEVTPNGGLVRESPPKWP